jgi:hypothetical protein
MPGSRPTWYLTYEYVGCDLTCDLQELQVAPLTVPLFLEGRIVFRGLFALARLVRKPSMWRASGCPGSTSLAARSARTAVVA